MGFARYGCHLIRFNNSLIIIISLIIADYFLDRDKYNGFLDVRHHARQGMPKFFAGV